MFDDEYPEQTLAVKYLPRDSVVLELGANVGRNTLTIATLLSKSSNLVALETDKNNAKVLESNKILNGLDFHIGTYALSKRKLIQKYWVTIPSDEVLDGYTAVDIMSYDELENNFNLKFDALVIDCEGAFYQILQDDESILKNINVIIMENDYRDINQKIYVDQVLAKYNLKSVYSEPGGFGPCQDYFFEVFIRCE
jgi:FkbM family methyltransferase